MISTNNDARNLFFHFISPLVDYISWLKKSFEPPEFVRHIRANSLNLHEAGKIACGALIISAIAAAAFGHDLGFLQLVDIPIVNEFLVLLYFSFSALIFCALSQPVLKRFGGVASFQQMFGAGLTLTAIYAPFLAIMSALIMKIYDVPPNLLDDPNTLLFYRDEIQSMRLIWVLVQTVPAIHFVVIIARLQEMSVSRTLGAMLLAGILLSVLAASLGFVAMLAVS